MRVRFDYLNPADASDRFPTRSQSMAKIREERSVVAMDGEEEDRVSVRFRRNTCSIGAHRYVPSKCIVVYCLMHLCSFSARSTITPNI